MSPRKPLQDIKIMNQLFPAAEAEALAMGEAEPGAEHLVLAALDLPDGSARRAFARLGSDPGKLRAAIAAQHRDTLESIGIAASDEDLEDKLPSPTPSRGPFRSKGSVQKVFKQVVKLVKKDKSQLYGAYVVLVAGQLEAGTFVRALAAMGVDAAELVAAARTELDIVNS